MANTHIQFGRVKNGYAVDAMAGQSLFLTGNATSANVGLGYSIATAVAIGGPVWLAVSVANGTANAANVSNRIYLPAGVPVPIGISGGLIKFNTTDTI